jgi:hypothetical protein
MPEFKKESPLELSSGEIATLLSCLDAMLLQQKVRAHVDSIVSTLLPDCRTMLRSACWGTNFDPVEALKAKLVIEGDRLRKAESGEMMAQAFKQKF